MEKRELQKLNKQTIKIGRLHSSIQNLHHDQKRHQNKVHEYQCWVDALESMLKFQTNEEILSHIVDIHSTIEELKQKIRKHQTLIEQIARTKDGMLSKFYTLLTLSLRNINELLK